MKLMKGAGHQDSLIAFIVVQCLDRAESVHAPDVIVHLTARDTGHARI